MTARRSIAPFAALAALTLAGVALAHFHYVEAELAGLSPDGRTVLCSLVEGDTEGGATGEMMGVWSLAAGKPVRPSSGSLGMPDLGGDGESPTLQEILPYHPSHGAGANHTDEELQAAPGLREAFVARARSEFGVTETPSRRTLERPTQTTFKARSDTITATVPTTAGEPTVLTLSGRKVRLKPVDDQHVACLYAIYRTDDANAFVVESFDWPVGEGESCPTNPGFQYGPPPQRVYQRVVF